jgi:hypothetical protein
VVDGIDIQYVRMPLQIRSRIKNLITPDFLLNVIANVTAEPRNPLDAAEISPIQSSRPASSGRSRR